jgi:hypothetical protein
MEPDFRYHAALARRQALIDESAERRLLSGSRPRPPGSLRRWMASRLRRVADRLEPSARSFAPVKRYDF